MAKKQPKIVGPTGRRTNRYIPGRKTQFPRPSVEELLNLLNEHGPLELSRKLAVSKVTVHSLMNAHGIESYTQWRVKGKPSGIDLIQKERKEQIEKHGRTTAGDMQYNEHFQLIVAAMALLQDTDRYVYLPTGWNPMVWKHMINKSKKNRMIMAGALIAAELDRINAIEGK